MSLAVVRRCSPHLLPGPIGTTGAPPLPLGGAIAKKASSSEAADFVFGGGSCPEEDQGLCGASSSWLGTASKSGGASGCSTMSRLRKPFTGITTLEPSLMV